MESEGITSQRAQAIAHHGGHSKDMPHELASAHNSLQQKLDAKGQHHAVAASVMHAVTAELDNFEVSWAILPFMRFQPCLARLVTRKRPS